MSNSYLLFLQTAPVAQECRQQEVSCHVCYPVSAPRCGLEPRCSLPVCLSVAAIKHWPKAAWGGKSLFYPTVYFLSRGKHRQKVKAGRKQRPQRVGLFTDWFSCLAYAAQVHLPGNDAVSSGVGLPASISSQKMPPIYTHPQASLMTAVPQISFSCSSWLKLKPANQSWWSTICKHSPRDWVTGRVSQGFWQGTLAGTSTVWPGFLTKQRLSLKARHTASGTHCRKRYWTLKKTAS